MAKYMVFYNTTSAMRAQMAEIPPEQAAAGMEGWMTWARRWVTGSSTWGRPS